MVDADEYEKTARENLRIATAPGSGWMGGLVKAVSGLGWAILAHMKREEERYTVVATETDPFEHLKDIVRQADKDDT